MAAKRGCAIAIVMLITGWAGGALAQEITAEVAPATDTARFVLNSLLLLLGGAAVLLMVAGLGMREAGLAQARNPTIIGLKSIAIVAVAGVMVWLTGYNLIHGVGEGGLLGTFAPWTADDRDPAGDGRASSSAWFFEMARAVLSAAIVAGALGDRIRMLPLLIFTAILCGLTYPIGAAWTWGGGYLGSVLVFSDFAGSTVIHAAAGWAALAGLLVLGPRRGLNSGGHAAPAPRSTPALALVGTLIVWLGWFGLNGGARMTLGTIEDATAIANLLVNTHMAGCGGVIAALLMTAAIDRKIDVAIVLNGAIGGLVAISAEPLHPAIWQATAIGAFGGVLVTVGAPLLERFRIDDVVGAIPAHLMCGVWGTLIAPWTNLDASFVRQFAGLAISGAFAFTMSILVFLSLRYSIGIRSSAEDAASGSDSTEFGLSAQEKIEGRAARSLSWRPDKG